MKMRDRDGDVVADIEAGSLRKAFYLAKEELTSSTHIVVILSLYWAYIHMLLYNNDFASSGTLPADWLFADQVWTLSLSCNALTVLVLAIISWKSDYILLDDRAIFSGPLLMSASVVLMAMGLFVPLPFGNVVYCIGVCLTGVGLGIIVVYLGFILSKRDSQRVVMDIALAMIGNALICVLLSAMDIWLVFAVMFTCPFVIFFLYRQAIARELGAQYCKRVWGKDLASRETRSFLMILMALAVIVGFSLGVIRNVTFTAYPWSMSRYYGFLAAVALSGVLLIMVIKSFSQEKSRSMLFVAILIIATAFFVMLIFRENSTLAQMVHSVGFYFFNGLFWVFVAQCSQQSGTVTKTFITAYTANQIGQLVGTMVSYRVVESADLTDMLSGYIPICMVYLLLVFVVLAFVKMSRLNPFATLQSYDDQLKDACERLAQRNDLTPRELEVMTFLAKGRDRSYVADQCLVSVETVKTYISRIYGKLGIHSRQDLLTLVEREITENESVPRNG